MATNPPFEMEDQTDEDFFDKLVDDDDEFGIPGPVPQSNFDVSKGFSNLSIKDGGSSGPLNLNAGSVDAAVADEKKVLPSSSSFDFDSVLGTEVNAVTSTDNLTVEDMTAANADKHLADADSGFSSVVAGESNSLVSSSSFEFDTLTASNDKRLESEGMVDMFKTKDVGSGGGIKEVGWSSFHADSVTAGGTGGFGSYSDFFTDLGDDNGSFPANMGTDLNNESEMLSGSADYSFDGSANQVDYALLQQGQGQEMGVNNEQSNNVHGMDDSQNWENLYPGWRYDYNTGQWYQIDGYDANKNLQGNFDNAAVAESVSLVAEKSDVSYLQQTAQSVARAVSEIGTTESISNLNQVSEANNGYPEHMVFDPQYPGWYYDMLVSEWRSLDDYTSSLQSTSQSLDHQNQTGTLSQDDNTMYHNYEPVKNYGPQGATKHNQVSSCSSSYNEYSTSNVNNLWQPEATAHSDGISGFGENRQFDAAYSQGLASSTHLGRQNSINSFAPTASYDQTSQSYVHSNGTSSFGFVPVQSSNQANMEKNEQVHFSNDVYGIQKTMHFPQQSFPTVNEVSHAHNLGQSPDGRPAHALVTFGFGGKLIMMKNTSSITNLSFGNQDPVGGSISVHNVLEVVQNSVDPNTGASASDYFRALCLQFFPGPLVGGSVGSKELNKWIDERIGSCDSSDLDHRRAEALRLLLSLLKIACQHYGKLRSPFGTDVALKEGDSPELAVAKLFASAKRSNNMQFGDYGGQRQCLQLLPPAGQIQATAYEVQNLLVSGRKHEALQRAQEGQLWGPALVLAWQLGNQFYEETVRQMALHQLVPGSPLRTLCLLVAGQPAEVFSANSPAISNVPHSSSMSQQPAQTGANGMLEDWEENLAIIAANRTKDDELVITHLGDCLWKDRSENIAAHLCYLVAEANFESYSDSARLCLVGADHWKCPRTYASPYAIQRTELYEYAKVMGNSQFILQPFQPYKLIYAHMLAEVGKISDSLKYCQALLKSLKTGRTPEVEMWRQVVVSLEDRLRTHQQGGYSANLAPAKLVGKLLNFFDSTAHKVVGTLPPSAPTPLQTGFQGNDHVGGQVSKVSNSQSTMAMSSLTPSASMEPISDWTADGNRMTAHNRSVSEPNFGRSPRQGGSSTGEATTDTAQGKASVSGGGLSRLSRFSFGSQLLQKTVGLVMRPRSDKQAKLGEKNKFYYDEKLKRWVEEGAEPPAEQAAPPPPPITAAFQNGTSDYNLKSALKSEGFVSDRSPESKGAPSLSDHTSSGIPPIPPSSNQFSARGRMGVRSRYVDTFNKGGGNPAASFQSPSIQAVKPPSASANQKFFIPSPAPAPAPASSSSSSPSSTDHHQAMDAIAENPAEDPTSTVATNGISSSSGPSPLPSASESSSSSSVVQFQRFPSVDNIQRRGSMVNVKNTSSFQSANSRRTASWSGSVNEASFGSHHLPNAKSQVKPLGELSRSSPPYMMHGDSSFSRIPPSSGSFDELQEVEL